MRATAPQQQHPRLVSDSERPGAGVGAILRGARLARDEELREVASALRIRLPYLEAIEEGRVEDLPGVTYGIGFVRGYAEYLGLDAADIVARFKLEARGIDRRTQLHFPEPLPGNRVPGAALLFLVLVLAGGVYGGWLYTSSQDMTFTEAVEALPDRFLALLEDGDAPATESGEISAVTPETAPTGGTIPDGTAPNATNSETASQAAALPNTNPSNTDPPGTVPTGTVPTGTVPTDAVPPATGTADTPEVPAPATAVDTSAPVQEPEPAATGETAVPAETDAPVTTEIAESGTAPTASTGAQDIAPAGTTAQAEETQSALPETGNQAPAVDPTGGTAADTEIPAPATEVVTPPAAEPTEPAQPATAESALPGTSQTVAADDTATPAPVPPQPETPPEPAATEAAVEPAATEIVTEELSAPPLPQEDAEPGGTPTESASETATAAAPSAGSGARIIIQATNESWIQVIDADGDVLIEKLMLMGEIYRVPDREGLTLNTGNAGALKLIVNGTLIPPLSTEPEVMRNISLSPGSLTQ